MAAANPVGGAVEQRARKLILHFDVNETILVGDPAGGDTFEDCLNKIIAKSAFVRCKDGTDPLTATSLSQLLWRDGSPLWASEVSTMGKQDSAADAVEPPALLSEWHWPEGCAPFYRVAKRCNYDARRLTEPGEPGCGYRALYERLETALRLPPGANLPPALSADGVHHYLVPAFFHTLEALLSSGRDFTLVVRTFGSDGARVADAITAWAERDGGAASAPRTCLRMDSTEQLWQGRYDSGGKFTLRQCEVGSLEAGGQECEGGCPPAARVLEETEAVQLLEARGAKAPSALLCNDHYGWWRQHGYSPSAGKPLWITLDDAETQHIFFDDNIHNDPADSIVAARWRSSAADLFEPLSGAETIELQHSFLVRCPTFEPILHPGWFLERITQCESNFEPARRRLTQLAAGN